MVTKLVEAMNKLNHKEFSKANLCMMIGMNLHAWKSTSSKAPEERRIISDKPKQISMRDQS